jgi:hypothetical protein
LPAVEDFLDRYNARDFDAVANCLSPTDFRRIGPFGDTIDSSSEYVEFLRGVVPTLGPRYRLTTKRIFYAGANAVAELLEQFEVDGELRTTPEVIVFDLDADGRITRMHLYVQRVNDLPPVGGRRAMGHRDE